MLVYFLFILLAQFFLLPISSPYLNHFQEEFIELFKLLLRDHFHRFPHQSLLIFLQFSDCLFQPLYFFLQYTNSLLGAHYLYCYLYLPPRSFTLFLPLLLLLLGSYLAYHL